MALGLIGVPLTAHGFGREGLRDDIDGQISFIDVPHFTMIAVTNVGCSDIAPVTVRARTTRARLHDRGGRPRRRRYNARLIATVA